MKAVAAAAAMLVLSACGASEQGQSNASLSDIANVSGLELETEDVPPVPAPRLEPLSRAEIEREISAGAGCDLSRDGRILLVAVGGEAIAKADGRIVRLRAEGSVEPNGAYFASDALRVSIGRASQEGRALDETTSWPARAAVSSPASDAPDEFDGSWTCGA